MDYGLLPPEVNSGRMYTGPGSGSLEAAANAWDGLAAMLNSVAASYASVLAGLSVESWLGPASATMVTAVAPFAGWLAAAAAQSEQSGNQARRAASAYETAFAMTVPPSLITANRNLVMSLIQTNIFGQNTAVIEAAQGEYAEMWAQDAAAMFTYAGASEAAATLTPFTPPAQIAHPAGAPEVGGGQSASAQPSNADTATLPAPAAPLDPIFDALGFPNPIEQLDFAALYIGAIGSASLALSIVNTTRPFSFQPGTHPPTDPGALVPTQTLGQITPLASPPGMGGAASAGIGQGALVGALKVPHSWTFAAPEIRLAVQSLPGASVGPAPADLSGAPVGLVSGMAVAGLAAGLGGRGATGTDHRGRTGEDASAEGQAERKPTVVVIQQPPQPSGGPGPSGSRPS